MRDTTRALGFANKICIESVVKGKLQIKKQHMSHRSHLKTLVLLTMFYAICLTCRKLQIPDFFTQSLLPTAEGIGFPCIKLSVKDEGLDCMDVNGLC